MVWLGSEEDIGKRLSKPLSDEGSGFFKSSSSSKVSSSISSTFSSNKSFADKLHTLATSGSKIKTNVKNHHCILKQGSVTIF